MGHPLENLVKIDRGIEKQLIEWIFKNKLLVTLDMRIALFFLIYYHLCMVFMVHYPVYICLVFACKMGGGLPDLGNHIPISNLGLYVLYVVICENSKGEGELSGGGLCGRSM